jgi:thymidylate synthase
LAEQIKQSPLPFPTVIIKEKHDNINDYTVDDVLVSDYKHHAKIEMKMRA